MKTTLKSTLAALSVAILTALAMSSCATKNGGSTSGTHTMGSKPGFPMSNDQMAGMR